MTLLIITTRSRWAYRQGPPASSKATLRKAEIVSAFMWWWVLHHLITEPEHITVGGMRGASLPSVLRHET